MTSISYPLLQYYGGGAINTLNCVMVTHYRICTSIKHACVSVDKQIKEHLLALGPGWPRCPGDPSIPGEP